MQRTRGALGPVALGLVLALPVTGCVAAAAGAAAGAAGAIAYNQRGAEADLHASVAKLVAATDAAFHELEIQTTSRRLEEGEGGAEIRGDEGETEIVVSIDPAGEALTHVEVTARKNVVAWDRDRAGEILRSIVART